MCSKLFTFTVYSITLSRWSNILLSPIMAGDSGERIYQKLLSKTVFLFIVALKIWKIWIFKEYQWLNSVMEGASQPVSEWVCERRTGPSYREALLLKMFIIPKNHKINHNSLNYWCIWSDKPIWYNTLLLFIHLYIFISVTLMYKVVWLKY